MRDELRLSRNSDELLSSQSPARCCRFTTRYIFATKAAPTAEAYVQPGWLLKPGKRARDNFKETRTHGGDDDESDGSTSNHPLEHRARGLEVLFMQSDFELKLT
jgi:hypothetical protein